MKNAYVFPGQGSQFVGMGADYFDRFPELVHIADTILGYSIAELCLDDPHKNLNNTSYTQPALYTVNALAYAAKLEDGAQRPDVVAGHSLGEYNALLAAGAFDFATGLKLVKKRGELMSQADQGGMLAVLGIDIHLVNKILDGLDSSKIQIANLNSARQTILSGDKAALNSAFSVFEQAGAKVVPLKVSAAFHSSYMAEARKQFEFYLRGFQFRELEIPVIANLTADLYPTSRFENYLADQITGAVRWHDTILSMLSAGFDSIEEVGPGVVLTKMINIIRDDLAKDNPLVEPAPKSDNLLFMYGGQGFHYVRMGHELYEQNPVFREQMKICDQIAQEKLNISIAHEFYEKDPDDVDLEDILLTHPAIYSFGYCLTKTLEAQGITPAAVMGYSLGEYVAATIAGSLDLTDALTLVCEQARLLKAHATNGSMLAVLTDISDFEACAPDYEGGTVSCINYNDNFIISGDREAVIKIKKRLAERDVLSLLLPVAHSFHSHQIDAIKSPFNKFAEGISVAEPKLKIYSPAKAGRVTTIDKNHLWDSIRETVDFHSTAENLKKDSDYRFVDLSPTASLASFLERSFGKSDKHHYAVNQFGNNAETMKKLISGLSD
ncbi:ACP S-malonyltransferase [Teredinibacter turnerae]|uniref:ACP S-malonyltransferase n=1 Tax=Teredinibacter turnerae TaxID=2426 RepID=UPI00036AAC2B|nr:ACP S-malonyltransferase [Teredinibacter turnerae]